MSTIGEGFHKEPRAGLFILSMENRGMAVNQLWFLGLMS
jgi:hypothetical protein